MNIFFSKFKAFFCLKGGLSFASSILIFSGCATTDPCALPRKSIASHNTIAVSDGGNQNTHDSSQGAALHDRLEERLRAAVSQWEGTPHHMGGNSRNGIDCSGFVRRLYLDIFNYKIPRSTQLQVQAGRTVQHTQLRSGDLVFFTPPDKKKHVGIYLGHMEFAHASTSKGVMISNLGDRYWMQCYWTARRYIQNPKFQ